MSSSDHCCNRSPNAPSGIFARLNKFNAKFLVVMDVATVLTVMIALAGLVQSSARARSSIEQGITTATREYFTNHRNDNVKYADSQLGLADKSIHTHRAIVLNMIDQSAEIELGCRDALTLPALKDKLVHNRSSHRYEDGLDEPAFDDAWGYQSGKNFGTLKPKTHASIGRAAIPKARAQQRLAYDDESNQKVADSDRHVRVRLFHDPTLSEIKTNTTGDHHETTLNNQLHLVVHQQRRSLDALVVPFGSEQWTLGFVIPNNELLEQIVRDRTIEIDGVNKETTGLSASLARENLRRGAGLDVAQRLQFMVLPPSRELDEINDLDTAGHMSRLCEVIVEHHAKPAREIKEAIIADVMPHIGTNKVYDDITVLVIKRL